MERSKKRIGRCTVSLALLLGLGVGSGCRTEFVGEARFPGGAQSCFKKCSDINMEMATFVYVGEYSTACACRPKRRQVVAAHHDDDDAAGTEGAVIAAAAGVVMQARDADAAAAAANQPHVYVHGP
jgi:hypothetical protein